MRFKRTCSFFLVGLSGFLFADTTTNLPERVFEVFHSISSHTLLSYVEELASDEYEGRLTGTEGYSAAAGWLAEQFRIWGLQAAGDDGGYFQKFPIAVTKVLPGCKIALHIPMRRDTLFKHYRYVDEFIPGSTSGSGKITAEVVYAGYGITAPELQYDDYLGVDVRGKIVLLEREVPSTPEKDPNFSYWRPYSFHQYKLQNAVRHGAAGMLYHYGPIANPNNAYETGFVYSHVGLRVVEDLFAGTGRNYQETINRILENRKPGSFRTGKRVTIENRTEHDPAGVGSNVMALIQGLTTDPDAPCIIVGAHLDHLGLCPVLMPGANDNASGVSVLMGVAQALSRIRDTLKKPVLIIAFGSEEQGVAGSAFYVEHPTFGLERTLCLLNLDGVGCGDQIHILAADNFPEIYESVRWANEGYVHRKMDPGFFHNLARPRLDAARFMWAGVKSLSFSVSGAPSYYHVPMDDVSTITPEILEDLTRILFLAVWRMATAD